MANAYRSVLKDAVNPTGNALPADVLSGKTFSNADGIDKTGTMVNNGAVTITLTAQDPSYTVPEGYHNGSGTVSFTPSGGDGADLVVTCSDAFAGSTISCTDGTTTFTETCPSVSPYEVTFESIPTGIWTVSGSAYGLIFSTSVTILDFSATLNAIPEGSTITPTDDVQTWLHCANIWDQSYNSISQVLADSTTLLALISDSNAVDYMVRSTTWASDVTADSSAMTYIGANDYCSNKLLSDSIWLNAICSSTYFENVLNAKVPTMTSATAPSGQVSQSGIFENQSNYSGWKAFDGSNSTRWLAAGSYSTSPTNYIQYMFVDPIMVKKIHLDFTTSWGATSNITKIKLQGSNDGSTFEDLQEFTSIGYPTADLIVSEAIEKYKYIRLQFTGYNASGTSIGNGYSIGLTTCQFYGRE